MDFNTTISGNFKHRLKRKRECTHQYLFIVKIDYQKCPAEKLKLKNLQFLHSLLTSQIKKSYMNL